MLRKDLRCTLAINFPIKVKQHVRTSLVIHQNKTDTCQRAFASYVFFHVWALIQWKWPYLDVITLSEEQTILKINCTVGHCKILFSFS